MLELASGPMRLFGGSLRTVRSVHYGMFPYRSIPPDGHSTCASYSLCAKVGKGCREGTGSRFAARRWATSFFILRFTKLTRQDIPLVFGKMRLCPQEAGIGRFLDDNGLHVRRHLV